MRRSLMFIGSAVLAMAIAVALGGVATPGASRGAVAIRLVATRVPAAKPAKTKTSSSGSITFSHATVVDSQRITGEPSLSISPTLNSSGQHDIYVSTPFGFLTTASFVWKSEDGGQSFHLVAGQQPPFGKPDTCIGGGDSSIVNDTGGNLYFTDLQGLTDVSGAVSTDAGRTFTATCNQANNTGVDRPWITTFGNPLTTGREYMAVDNVGQCTYECGLGQAGSNILGLTQASGATAAAQVFQPMPTQQIEPDGIVGGIVADQSTGALFVSHSALTTPSGTLTGGSDANGNDNAVVVDVFPKGYSQTLPTPIPPGAISLCKPYNPAGPCTSSTVYSGPLSASGNSEVTVGQDFTPVAIDSHGDIYVVWAQSPVNPSTGLIDGPTAVYLATSTNQGQSWSKPIDVSGNLSSLQTNIFPAVAAAGNGGVDVAWYGTTVLGNCSGASGCGSSNIQGSWNVYLAQSLNTVTSSGTPNQQPTFTTAKVSEYPNHYGAICTMGIGCSTGGDRGLLDFIQVQADPSGAANVVWADAANTNSQGGTSSATIDFARQVSGPGLLGTAVAGTAPATGCAPGSPDGFYSANGTETKDSPNLQIIKSCISGPNASGNYVVTMKVDNLSSLAVSPTEGGPDAVWLTRWELPTASPSVSDQGHVFYAAMESDSGAAPSFYAGETQTLAAGTTATGTGQGFFMTYPPEQAVTGSYTAGSPGTITINVPAKDVGNSSASLLRLFSVTGMTVTQSEPSSLSGSLAASVFNVIDSTAPYDAG
ncbi:MAG: hypothetical protein ACYCSF_05440 [Acidimicrobiales bacterium]